MVAITIARPTMMPPMVPGTLPGGNIPTTASRPDSRLTSTPPMAKTAIQPSP